MNTNMLRVLSGVALAGALVAAYVASLYFRAAHDPNAQIWENQKAYMAMLQADDAKWNALEALDTYGGATPEETWGMYIDALKKGDIELAAKYYQVDQQGESYEDFKVAKQNNVLPKLIEIGSLKMRNTCEVTSASCELTTVPFDGSTMGVSFFFRINKQTHVWKIYDPTKNHQH